MEWGGVSISGLCCFKSLLRFVTVCRARLWVAWALCGWAVPGHSVRSVSLREQPCTGPWWPAYSVLEPRWVTQAGTSRKRNPRAATSPRGLRALRFSTRGLMLPMAVLPPGRFLWRHPQGDGGLDRGSRGDRSTCFLSEIRAHTWVLSTLSRNKKSKNSGANRMEDGAVVWEAESDSGLKWSDARTCWGVEVHDHKPGSLLRFHPGIHTQNFSLLCLSRPCFLCIWLLWSRGFKRPHVTIADAWEWRAGAWPPLTWALWAASRSHNALGSSPVTADTVSR